MTETMLLKNGLTNVNDDDIPGTDRSTSKKDSVVSHVANQMHEERAEQEKDPLHLSSKNMSSRKKLKRREIISKDYLDDSSDEDSPGDIGFIWKEWTINEAFLESFSTKMKLLVKKWSSEDKEPISEAFALVEEKQSVRNDPVKEAEINKQIEFYIQIYSKFIFMKNEYPETLTKEMLSTIQATYKQPIETFKKNLLPNNVTKEEPILDVESEEEFVEKSGDYFEMLTSSKDNVPSAVGSGPIFVRFSYSNSSQVVMGDLLISVLS